MANRAVRDRFARDLGLWLADGLILKDTHDLRVPGGIAGAWLVGVCPLLLLGFAALHGQQESVLGMSALAFGGLLMLAGVAAYWLNGVVKPEGWMVPALEPSPGTD